MLTFFFRQCPAINAVVCNAVCKTKWEFVMYGIPKVTFQYLEMLCDYCSVHCGHILLPAFPNHQFTRCSACSDRSGVCLCLLQPYGYCSGVNDVPHVQDLKMSREIQYTVITTSCVKAQQQINMILLNWIWQKKPFSYLNRESLLIACKVCDKNIDVVFMWNIIK